MIKTPIKIYGLPKTGTTYLYHLINTNSERRVIEPQSRRYGCKHGCPQVGGVQYVFLFRDVYEWTKSLLASDPSTVDTFHGLQEQYGKHNQFWETPFAYRNERYYQYMSFARLHNGILLKYDYLRTSPDCIADLLGVESVEDISNHVYKDASGKDNPTREDLRSGQAKIIEKHIDPQLESFVDDLSIRNRTIAG